MRRSHAPVRLRNYSLFLAVLAGVLAISIPPSYASGISVPLAGAEVFQSNTIRAEVSGNGRDLLRISFTNLSPEPLRITIPAGSIFKGRNGDRVIVLRSAEIPLGGKGAADAELPAAALSSQNQMAVQPFAFTPESEQKIDRLLKFLASSNDVPRATSQLLVLALLEDITFAKWQQFVAPQRTGDTKAANDLINAIDALGILREIEPDSSFALARDNELKLRALRNPVTRGKAVHLYGLSSPETPDSLPAGAPNLKQLLHTQPGDDCPVCRMRERAGRGAGDF